MFHSILAATLTFYYSMIAGSSYRACTQELPAGTPQCVTMTASPFPIGSLKDDTDYLVWVSIDGVDSAKGTAHTQKKTVIPVPAVVTAP